MNKKILIIIYVLVVCCWARADVKNEWIELINNSAENSATIKMYQEDIKKAERELKNSKAAFFPQLSLQGSVGADLFNLDDFSENNLASTLILDWDFFQNGALLYRIETAKSQVELVKLAFEKRKMEMIYEIKNLFLDIFQEQLNMEVDQLELALATRKMEVFDKQLELGKITRVVWLKEKMRLLELENNKQLNVKSFNSRRDRLNQVLLKDVDINQFDWSFILELIIPIKTFDECIEIAQKQRHDLIESGIQLYLAEKAFKYAKWKRLPKVSFFSGSDYALDDLGTQNSDIQFRTGAIVRYPLYDGGATKSQILLAELSYKRACINNDVLQERVMNDIKNQLSDWEFNVQRLELEKKYYSLTNDEMDKASIDFKQGKISDIEFQEILLNEKKSLTRLNKAKLDLYRKQMEIAKIIGTNWLLREENE